MLEGDIGSHHSLLETTRRQQPAVHLACADLHADQFLNTAAERSIEGTLEIVTHL